MLEDRERLERAYRDRVDAYEGVADDFRDRWLAWCRALLAHGGLWRQHSWAVDPDGALRETKQRHERYVGMTLAAGEPTVRFALNNYEGDVRAFLQSGSPRAVEVIRVLEAVRDRHP